MVGKLEQQNADIRHLAHQIRQQAQLTTIIQVQRRDRQLALTHRPTLRNGKSAS
jgi:hypothetical protein